MNALNDVIKGRRVVVLAKHFNVANLPERERIFLCREGFGCYPFTIGRSIFGTWESDGADGKISGMMIEKFA